MEELLNRTLNYYVKILITENLSNIFLTTALVEVMRRNCIQSYYNNTTKSLMKLSNKNIKLISKKELLELEEKKVATFSDNIKFYRNLAVSNSLIFVLAIVSMMTLGKFSFNVQVNSEKNNILSENNIENVKYVIDNFEYLIDNNNDLSEESKDFLKKTKIILEENEEFINGDNIDSFFKYVCIDYDSEYSSISRASGIYINTLKYLAIAESEETANKTVLLHETLHGYSKNFNNGLKLGYNFYLNEIVTQLYTLEYKNILDLEDYFSIYDEDIVIAYMIAHLVGVDVIKEYKFNNNFYIIEDALVLNGADRSDASLLLEYINNIYNVNGYEESRNNFNLYNTFRKLHQSIYDIPFEEDIKFLLYIKNSRFANEDSEYYFAKYLRDNNIASDVSDTLIYLEYIIADDNILTRPNPVIEFSDGSVYIVEENHQKVR